MCAVLAHLHSESSVYFSSLMYKDRNELTIKHLVLLTGFEPAIHKHLANDHIAYANNSSPKLSADLCSNTIYYVKNNDGANLLNYSVDLAGIEPASKQFLTKQFTIIL